MAVKWQQGGGGRGCDKERREGWKLYTGTEKGRK